VSALATPTPAPDPDVPERDLLRAVAAGTAGVVGEAFLRSLTHHVAEAFDAEVAFVAETLERTPGRVRIVASWQRGTARLPEGAEFDVDGTPCALAGERDVVAFPVGACTHFPRAAILHTHGLDGFLAVTLRGAGGVPLGHLGILSRRRIEATGDEIAALSIFAARAGAEIERRRHEIALREREAEVALPDALPSAPPPHSREVA
jgi:GAF domain-containing protein